MHRGRRRGRVGARTGSALAVVAVAAVAGAAAASEALGASNPATSAAVPANAAELSVTKQFFGQTTEPYTGQETDVYRYTLTNADHLSVQILTYGGIIQSINVPDHHGRLADVALGFPTLQDYVTQDSPPVTATGGPYFGEVIGRYANRIAGGRFTLIQPGFGPVTYTVPQNDAASSLNGGLVGFGNHIWSDQAVQGSGYVGVQLTLVSPNGDTAGAAGSPGCPNGCTGYPGTVKTVVTYTLNSKDELGIKYQATDESPNLNTVINPTNDTYFNLAGENAPAGSAYGQYVRINANK
jgi:aldose 1-epimerase